jgi:hypothetical protein
MRLFFIGSVREEKTEEIKAFCRRLGIFLAAYHAEVLLCSPFDDSVDYHIIRGIEMAERVNIRIELHYPKTSTIENFWDRELESLSLRGKISRYHYDPASNEEGKVGPYGWLFAQLMAVQKADFVIILGGKLDGSANLLCRIADSQSRKIIPFARFGGAGEQFFFDMIYRLGDYWGEHTRELFHAADDPENIIEAIVNKPNDPRFEQTKTSKKRLRFFLSYAKDRPAEADFVEMLLRRRGHEVLRDETEFGAGRDILGSIKENIVKADVFIAIWCKEYACSPWCFDELSYALEGHQRGQKPLWIFRTDNTRMVHPLARTLLSYHTETREMLSGTIISLLEGKTTA